MLQAKYTTWKVWKRSLLLNINDVTSQHLHFCPGGDEVAAQDSVLIGTAAEASGGHREHAQTLLYHLHDYASHKQHIAASPPCLSICHSSSAFLQA